MEVVAAGFTEEAGRVLDVGAFDAGAEVDVGTAFEVGAVMGAEGASVRAAVVCPAGEVVVISGA